MIGSINHQNTTYAYDVQTEMSQPASTHSGDSKGTCDSNSSEPPPYMNLTTKDNRYCILCKNGESKVISDFIMSAFEKIEGDDKQDAFYKLKIVTDKGEEFELLLSAKVLMNISDFRKSIAHLPISFFGGTNELLLVRGHIIAQNPPITRCVPYIGVHELDGSYVFVGSNTINSNNESVTGVILTPEMKALETSLDSCAKLENSERKQIIESLLKYNSLAKTLIILGFVVTLFFRKHFIDLGKKTPNCRLLGEAGSGKTGTVERVIKPFFSIVNGESISADQVTSTANMLMCGTSNVIPFFIDEYKPSKFPKKVADSISSLLRDSYDNSAGIRSGTDLKIRKYPLINPVVMAGEESIVETAVMERSIELIFAKFELTEECAKHFMYLKDNPQNINKLGKELLLFSLKTPREAVKEIFNKNEKQMEQCNLPNRVTSNVALVATGIILINEMLKQLPSPENHDLTSYTSKSIDEMVALIIKEIAESYKNDTSDDYNVVENTIKLFDEMATRQKLINDVDYRIIDYKMDTYNDMTVALHMPSVFKKFLAYIKDENIQEGIITEQKVFTALLRKSKYFKEKTKMRYKYEEDLEGGYKFNRDSYVLTLKELPEELELQALKFISKEQPAMAMPPPMAMPPAIAIPSAMAMPPAIAMPPPPMAMPAPPMPSATPPATPILTH